MKNMLTLTAAVCVAAVSAQTLEEGFRAPPRSARPQTWYHLMNGNVSKAGITRDFEEIAKVGLGGVQMFDIGSDAPPGLMTFGTPEWFDFMKHAHREAVRLGLEVAVRDGTGWSNSGGKWITPEHSMKNTTYTETNVAGPQKRWRAKLRRTERDCGFYRDVAVLAYPTPKGNVELSEWPLKTGRARTRFSSLEHDKRTFSAAEIVAKERVIDLTDRMKPDGTIEWDVPDGNWTVLRLGYAGTGRFSHPTSHDAGGPEVDKLSAKALDIHFDSYVGRLMRHIGVADASERSCGVNGVLVDSYEVSGQNWTQDLDKTFETRMGYSIRPWLPVFAKRIVGSTEATERFLDDFRRVLADLFADNYIGRLAERCHEFGLKLWFEPYGNGVFDDLQTGRRSDVPMGEFWNRVCLGEHGKGGPGNVRLAAYVSHVWGRRFVAAEAFTSSPPAGGRWMATPFAIKSQGDRAYAEGMNLVVYHRYTHQPWPDDKYLPGMTMGRHGMHLDRTQTWWKYAPAWFRYQSRCQWMLQEGTFVADALYWAGEQTPNTGFGNAGIQHPEDDMRAKYRAKNGRTNGTLSNGWNWDVCDTEALAELKVRDGKIVVPGGVEYAILVLPAAEVKNENTRRRIRELAEAGAKVVSIKDSSPEAALKGLGLVPDFLCTAPDAAWTHRRDGAADWYFVARDNETNVTFEASFRVTGKVPEIWNAETGEIRDAMEWRIEGGRTFVTFDFPPSGSAFVVFRRGGKPNVKCKMENVKLQDDASTLHSTFYTLHSPWQVSFPVDWYTGGDAVKSFEWPALKDWTANADPDIKYFSGTAMYKRKVESVKCKVETGDRIILDLGEVKHFAEVKVNGKAYPPLWRPPFRIDITDAVFGRAGSPLPADAAVAGRPPYRTDTGRTGRPRPADIDLEIKVTNLWPNRLIGDDVQFDDDCQWRIPPRGGTKELLAVSEIPKWVKNGAKSPTGRNTFTTYKHWSKKDKPLPSGLLGPVTIEYGWEQAVENERSKCLALCDRMFIGDDGRRVKDLEASSYYFLPLRLDPATGAARLDYDPRLKVPHAQQL